MQSKDKFTNWARQAAGAFQAASAHDKSPEAAHATSKQAKTAKPGISRHGSRTGAKGNHDQDEEYHYDDIDDAVFSEISDKSGPDEHTRRTITKHASQGERPKKSGVSPDNSLLRIDLGNKRTPLMEAQRSNSKKRRIMELSVERPAVRAGNTSDAMAVAPSKFPPGWKMGPSQPSRHQVSKPAKLIQAKGGSSHDDLQDPADRFSDKEFRPTTRSANVLGNEQPESIRETAPPKSGAVESEAGRLSGSELALSAYSSMRRRIKARFGSDDSSAAPAEPSSEPSEDRFSTGNHTVTRALNREDLQDPNSSPPALRQEHVRIVGTQRISKPLPRMVASRRNIQEPSSDAPSDYDEGTQHRHDLAGSEAALPAARYVKRADCQCGECMVDEGDPFANQTFDEWKEEGLQHMKAFSSLMNEHVSAMISRFENFNAVSARYDGGLKALQLRRDELHQEAVAVAKLFWGDNWAAEVRPRS